MIVYVYPADAYGCGFYRLGWPGAALAAAGHQVRVSFPHEREGVGGAVDSRTGKLVNIQVPADADVVVLQRVAFAHMAQAVPMMRERGIAVVVDMDDDLTKIDPANPAFWGFKVDQGSRWHNLRNADAACRDATLVTVSTPALLKIYAPHGRGLVVENRVPARYLDVPRVDHGAIGWPGAVHTHPNDLEVVGPAVQRLVREGVRYLGAGAEYRFKPGDNGLRRALGIDDDVSEEAFSTLGDVGELDRWPDAVAQLGVGMAPLADTGFNSAKSWLKALEMMACGVPWVGSPRAEYARLQRRTGVGLLARQPKDWYRLLKRLAGSEAERIEQSEAGRLAARDLTIEVGAWRWLEAWQHALNIQRGQGTTGS